MDIRTFKMAAKSIPIIQAKKRLEELKVSAYSMAQASERKDIHKSFYDQAFPNQEQRILRTTDVLKAIK